MDINYDPSEEEVDDVDGVLDYDKRRCQWRLLCTEHGEIERAADGSAEEHDRLVHLWVDHLREDHHGDGRLTPAHLYMLLCPELDRA